MRDSENHKMPINPFAARAKKVRPSVEELAAGILAGNHVLLSQGLTLIESTLPRHQADAKELIEKCLPFANKSVRIGITGVPGVGKSTFIEAFGKHLLAEGKRLAVLAIDPSSQRSKGSILGDKTRMAQLAADERAFIRPSPAGDSLGGVARTTRESILLCEAAGYEVIIVETVGVGQSEIAVNAMVDFFLLLLLPNAGDELQGIKRGIVEMADAIAVNKSDGDYAKMAKVAKKSYQNALHLFPLKESLWTPQTLTCSALHHEGIAEIWAAVQDYCQFTQANGYFAHKRQTQLLYWFEESIKQGLQHFFQEHERVKPHLEAMKMDVLALRRSPFAAADALLKLVWTL